MDSSIKAKGSGYEYPVENGMVVFCKVGIALSGASSGEVDFCILGGELGVRERFPGREKEIREIFECLARSFNKDASDE